MLQHICSMFPCDQAVGKYSYLFHVDGDPTYPGQSTSYITPIAKRAFLPCEHRSSNAPFPRVKGSNDILLPVLTPIIERFPPVQSGCG